MENHTKMINVLDESAPLKIMVCKWTNLFKSVIVQTM